MSKSQNQTEFEKLYIVKIFNSSLDEKGEEGLKLDVQAAGNKYLNDG